MACSASNVPTIRMSESRVGKIPTTRVRDDFLMESLESVRRVQPAAVLAPEVRVGEDIFGSVFQELGGLRELR